MSDINSSLIFNDYVVNNVTFTTNNQFEEEQIDVQFDIDRKVDYDTQNDDIAYVTLEVKIFENPLENNYPFSLFLSITGIFKMQDVEEDKKDYFAKYNAVAILFPYVRSLVSTFTANANVPPLILPPINVLKIIDG